MECWRASARLRRRVTVFCGKKVFIYLKQGGQERESLVFGSVRRLTEIWSYGKLVNWMENRRMTGGCLYEE
ncbi:hypothetical protein TNCV_2581861 [Trichonephila clavipes]|nr:hypothetical protein TNCV_2581861 [Trichonephila clavipes]